MIEEFIHAASTLTADSVDKLGSFYSEDCEFTDPFQTVHGRAAVIDIYREMFSQLHAPEFSRVRVLGLPKPNCQGQELVVAWEFSFALSPTKARQTIPGCSLLQLNESLHIVRHFDYWDASALMQSLPVLGPVIGFVRKKISQNSKSSP